jgi:hypothetical protein
LQSGHSRPGCFSHTHPQSSQRMQVMLMPIAHSFRLPQIVRVESPIHLGGSFGISDSQFLLGPFNTGRRTPTFLAKPCRRF